MRGPRQGPRRDPRCGARRSCRAKARISRVSAANRCAGSTAGGRSRAPARASGASSRAPSAVMRGSSKDRPPDARRNASASARAARRVGSRMSPRAVANGSGAAASHSAGDGVEERHAERDVEQVQRVSPVSRACRMRLGLGQIDRSGEMEPQTRHAQRARSRPAAIAMSHARFMLNEAVRRSCQQGGGDDLQAGIDVGHHFAFAAPAQHAPWIDREVAVSRLRHAPGRSDGPAGRRRPGVDRRRRRGDRARAWGRPPSRHRR